MKTLCLACTFCFGLLALGEPLNARVVTLTISLTNTTNSLSITSNESVALLCGKNGGNGGVVTIEKDGLRQTFDLSYFDSIQTGKANPVFVISGPAKVSLGNFNGGADSFSFLSVEVQTEPFPPDKTVIVPEGTGANIALEASTNLINWAPASPGWYTNRTGNLFFRIRADRILP